MSRKEDFVSIQKLPYQPIFSGKLATRHHANSAKKRPVTVATVTKEYLDLSEYESDNESGISTNISLFSVESSEVIHRKKSRETDEVISYFERYMNRRLPTEYQVVIKPLKENTYEPTLYDLLGKDELENIFNMFNVEQAVPFRIRSKSVSSQFRTLFENKTDRKNFVKRSKSVGCSDKVVDEIETKKDDTKNSVHTYNSSNNNDSYIPNEDIGVIKGPDIYSIGNNKPIRRSKAKSALSTRIEDKKIIKNPYDKIESKLKRYLSGRKKPEYDVLYVSSERSKTAINRQFVSSTPYVKYKSTYTPTDTARFRSYLQLSCDLDSRIKNDTRKNIGPIYFGQFTSENIENFHGTKKLNLQDKYYYIYEWLDNIKTDECQHFLENPFQSSKSINTDVVFTDKTIDTVDFKRLKINKNNFQTNNKLIKIDAFENPKYSANKPSNQNKDIILKTIKNKICEDKQTLACKREFKKYLHLDRDREYLMGSINSVKNQDEISIRRSEVRDKLLRYRSSNDVLLKSMQLDIYVL